jgi:hypothetical protein
MGVDFAAILAHPFDNSDILSLPERLNADREVLGKAAIQFQRFVKRSDQYPLLKEESSWSWNVGHGDWDSNDPEGVWDIVNQDVFLQGPGLLSVHFGRASCHFFAPFKWSRFVTDAPTQIETRKINFAVVKAFAGNKAIYLPDSGSWRVTTALDLVLEGATFQQIEEWLLKNVGESAPTIEKVHDLMQTGDLGSYFIDDFADFKIES